MRILPFESLAIFPVEFSHQPEDVFGRGLLEPVNAAEVHRNTCRYDVCSAFDVGRPLGRHGASALREVPPPDAFCQDAVNFRGGRHDFVPLCQTLDLAEGSAGARRSYWYAIGHVAQSRSMHFQARD
jgi:hypothetical protein